MITCYLTDKVLRILGLLFYCIFYENIRVVVDNIAYLMRKGSKRVLILPSGCMMMMITMLMGRRKTTTATTTTTITTTPNLAIELVALLLRMVEIPGANLGPETGYPD
jgi:hypothetical protein